MQVIIRTEQFGRSLRPLQYLNKLSKILGNHGIGSSKFLRILRTLRILKDPSRSWQDL